MPTPRGVVKLWSALRAFIDLTCAWQSLWTDHIQPLLADGCGRPRGALLCSFLRSLVFQLLYIVSCCFKNKQGLYPGGISLPALCTAVLMLSACFSGAVLFFIKLQWQSSQLTSPGRFGFCLNLSCAVSILPLQKPQRRKRSFVDTYAPVQLIHFVWSLLYWLELQELGEKSRLM